LNLAGTDFASAKAVPLHKGRNETATELKRTGGPPPHGSLIQAVFFLVLDKAARMVIQQASVSPAA
jgi:hypothetical protein